LKHRFGTIDPSSVLPGFFELTKDDRVQMQVVRPFGVKFFVYYKTAFDEQFFRTSRYYVRREELDVWSGDDLTLNLAPHSARERRRKAINQK
jgi:hypothetical protein